MSSGPSPSHLDWKISIVANLVRFYFRGRTQVSLQGPTPHVKCDFFHFHSKSPKIFHQAKALVILVALSHFVCDFPHQRLFSPLGLFHCIMSKPGGRTFGAISSHLVLGRSTGPSRPANSWVDQAPIPVETPQDKRPERLASHSDTHSCGVPTGLSGPRQGGLMCGDICLSTSVKRLPEQ